VNHYPCSVTCVPAVCPVMYMCGSEMRVIEFWFSFVVFSLYLCLSPVGAFELTSPDPKRSSRN
jgi:hypothetical protein